MTEQQGANTSFNGNNNRRGGMNFGNLFGGAGGGNPLGILSALGGLGGAGGAGGSNPLSAFASMAGGGAAAGANGNAAGNANPLGALGALSSLFGGLGGAGARPAQAPPPVPPPPQPPPENRAGSYQAPPSSAPPNYAPPAYTQANNYAPPFSQARRDETQRKTPQQTARETRIKNSPLSREWPETYREEPLCRCAHCPNPCDRGAFDTPSWAEVNALVSSWYK
ncbi:MAG: hypothetical protein FWE85_01075 [Clostridiales bacterium]|nr:hypothetical protein [Clostridiales bacterium]